MKRCTRCLYPETKPDLHFNRAGVCSACVAFDLREGIDWDDQRERFMAIVAEYRGGTHDVIVACSGGKDSTAQIVRCLDLGLRPLAVTASTDDLSPIGRMNLDNVANLCDHVEVTVDKVTRREIARHALETVGDISWCEHHLIWSIPAREAKARGIPLVLYGECPQNEYGAGPGGSEHLTILDKRWVHEFGGLLGMRLDDVVEQLELDPRAVELYRYPNDLTGVRGVFMGAYFQWDGYENYRCAIDHGFTPFLADHVEGSLYNYENLDNHQTGIHDYLRFLKFGYGRAVDIASSHIRRGRLTRTEAIALIENRDGAFPWTYLGEPLERILGRIGMTVPQFMEICGEFENRAIFGNVEAHNLWRVEQ